MNLGFILLPLRTKNMILCMPNNTFPLLTQCMMQLAPLYIPVSTTRKITTFHFLIPDTENKLLHSRFHRNAYCPKHTPSHTIAIVILGCRRVTGASRHRAPALRRRRPNLDPETRILNERRLRMPMIGRLTRISTSSRCR